MSLTTTSFDLQITPGSIPPILKMGQYDNSRQYTAYLKDETNSAFVPGTGATAKIKGRNAAGVPWEQAATVDCSTVVFTPSGAATDQFGIMPVTIEITVGSEKLTPLLMIFDIQKSGYTNEEAVRSPEFQTAIDAAVAAAIEEGGLGFSDDFKEALLACFSHVAWADEEGQTYYDALHDALYPAPGPVTLVSITADYEQDRPIYDTDNLDAIKAGDDLTVTANYSDDSSVVLGDDDYELSGTLTVGTSTITVSYGGKTTTISVLVTESGVYVGYESIGTPSITGNILTPSSNGSVRTNHVFSPGTSPWKIQVGFTYTGGGSSAYMDVFGSCTSSGTNERVMLLEKSVGFGVFLSSGTSSWNITQAGMVFSATNNATYLFELEYTGAEYRRRYSTDNGSTWSEYSSVSSTTAILGGYYVGFGISRNGILDGTIDLATCKIWIDGDLWWKAVA